jgi:hypothetical protein
MPRWEPAETVEEATATMLREAESKSPPTTVCVDEFTYLAERTFAGIEKRLGKTNDGRKLFGENRNAILAFRDVARYAGFNVLLGTWLSEPGVKGADSRTGRTGKFVRGGPKLPGDLPDYFPGVCDLVLKAEFDARAQPWGAVYRCYPSDQWTMRDRDDKTPDPAPLNMGEILRLNGCKGLGPAGGSDEGAALVENMACLLVEQGVNADRPIVEAAYQGLVKEGKTPQQAYWIVSDAWDRANLKRASAMKWSGFVRAGL